MTFNTNNSSSVFGYVLLGVSSVVLLNLLQDSIISNLVLSYGLEVVLSAFAVLLLLGAYFSNKK